MDDLRWSCWPLSHPFFFGSPATWSDLIFRRRRRRGRRGSRRVWFSRIVSLLCNEICVLSLLFARIFEYWNFTFLNGDIGQYLGWGRYAFRGASASFRGASANFLQQNHVGCVFSLERSQCPFRAGPLRKGYKSNSVMKLDDISRSRWL